VIIYVLSYIVLMYFTICPILDRSALLALGLGKGSIELLEVKLVHPYSIMLRVISIKHIPEDLVLEHQGMLIVKYY
jgi:hypothetical protein